MSELCVVLLLFSFSASVQVLSADGTQSVGRISKQWGGLAKEYFTDADNFGIQCKAVVVTVFQLHS